MGCCWASLVVDATAVNGGGYEEDELCLPGLADDVMAAQPATPQAELAVQTVYNADGSENQMEIAR